MKLLKICRKPQIKSIGQIKSLALDTGNRSMRRARRRLWNEEDWDRAVDMYELLLEEYVEETKE